MKSVEIRAPVDIVKVFLLDPYLVLRLNPSWFIREITADDQSAYSILLYDDRSDDIHRIHLHIEVSESSVSYRIDSETIVFMMHTVNPATTRLSVSGGFFREEDLPYWLKGLKNYIRLETKQSGMIRWLLDRVWLRMTPSQRRIAVIIILAEGTGLAALAAVIIALKFLR